MAQETDQNNVYGTELLPCSTDPQTGYLRDGYCHEHPQDRGCHELCAVVTEEFLEYSKAQGNNLITPRPEFNFPGLDPGDRWCLCVDRWIEAEEAGVAPPVVLEATNESVLTDIDTETLKAYEYEG
ncbi:DUF2237 family protein [Halovenus sp. HT40]|uniref:DUF2237 family protein n=1 Tax=Halovenus sp. HT40 TaxID=3126691 RepID=UPI00300F5137